jgi:hypothetical protein
MSEPLPGYVPGYNASPWDPTPIPVILERQRLVHEAAVEAQRLLDEAAVDAQRAAEAARRRRRNLLLLLDPG